MVIKYQYYYTVLLTLNMLFIDKAILRRAWSEVSTVMVSEMKSGPSIRQMVMRAPAFLGLPAS